MAAESELIVRHRVSQLTAIVYAPSCIDSAAAHTDFIPTPVGGIRPNRSHRSALCGHCDPARRKTRRIRARYALGHNSTISLLHLSLRLSS